MRTLVAFDSAWRQNPALATRLLDNLQADLERLASERGQQRAAPAARRGAGAPGKAGRTGGAWSEATHKLLAVAACAAAILEAAAPAMPEFGLPQLLRYLQALATTVQQPTMGASSTVAAVAELSGHVARLASLAEAATALQGSAGSTSSGTRPSAARVAEPAGQQGEGMDLSALAESLPLEEQAAVRPAGGAPAAVPPQHAPLLGACAAAATFCASAVRRPAVLAQPAAVCAVLAAQRRWLQLLIDRQLEPALEAAAAELLATGPARSPGAGWLLRLRSHSSKEVLQSLAQLLFLLLQHSATALELLLSDLRAVAAAAAAPAPPAAGPAKASTSSAGPGSDPGTGDEQEAAQPVVPLLFTVQLLQKAVGQLPAGSAASIWAALHSFALPGAGLSTQAWCAVLALLHGAAALLVAQQDAEAAAAAAQRYLDLVAVLLQSSKLADAVVLRGLQGLQHVLPHMPAHGSYGASLEDTVSLVAAAADAPSAAVRQAATQGLQALASSAAGSRLLLLRAQAAAQVFHAAVLRLGDVHPAVATAAAQLVVSAAATLALAGGVHSSGTGQPTRSSAPALAAAAALQPQSRGFRPAQLQQLLSHLTGEAPAAVVLAAAADRQDGEVQQWLANLLPHLPAMPQQRPAAAAAAALAAASAASREAEPATSAPDYHGPAVEIE